MTHFATKKPDEGVAVAAALAPEVVNGYLWGSLHVRTTSGAKIAV
jgi:hypothetical protein